MKKIYSAPAVEILPVKASQVICASVSFGTGETDQMHTKEEVWLYDEDENNVKAWDW